MSEGQEGFFFLFLFYKHVLGARLCAHTADFLQEVDSQMLEIVLMVEQRGGGRMHGVCRFIHVTSALLSEGGLFPCGLCASR